MGPTSSSEPCEVLLENVRSSDGDPVRPLSPGVGTLLQSLSHRHQAPANEAEARKARGGMGL